MLALVTDSTCGLTRNEAAELGVDVLPMGYVSGGVRHAEGFMGENGSYGRDVIVSTEAVRPSAFEAAFRRHLDAGDEVLCLTISARLSGTFRSAEQAAEALGDARVTLLDSWGTAGALEFLVRRARALANAGGSVAQIVEELSALRASTRIVFSVPDMVALSRSGRLGAIRRAVATKLNRYPVMTLSEGAIVKLDDGRGARGMAEALVSRAPEDASELLVSHFGERGVEAREVLLAARRAFPEAHIRVKDGGPVLAKHLGIGAVALSWA